MREVAEMVRITHLLGKMPGQCSGGESQRIALARTLVTNPSTFLLDEPLSSLDAKLRRELRAECDRLHQALKRTFIYVTHDQEEAMTLADRIVVMRAGEIEQVGSPMEIYSNPVSYFVADFFGSPSMNLVAGEIVQNGDGARFRSATFRRRAARPLQGREAGRRHARHPARARRRRQQWRRAAGDVAAGAAGRAARPDTLLYFDAGASAPSSRSAKAWAWPRCRSARRCRSRFDPERLHLFDADGRRLARACLIIILQ